MTSDTNRTINGGVASSYSAGTADLSKVNHNELDYASGLGYQSSQGTRIGVRYNGACTNFTKAG